MAFFVYFYMNTRPNYLQKGDAVIIIAPAGRIRDGGLDRALEILQGWGLEVIISDHALDGYNYFSASDFDRLSDLQRALDSTDYKAIFCARGGYGLTRIIDQLDFTQFIKSPKWVIGFSDVTALHLTLSKRGMMSIHSIMPTGLESAEDQTVDSLRMMLFGEQLVIVTPESKSNRKGTCEGSIIGGNLSLLSSSIGTKNELQTDGKILFIEEIDEYLYKIDRMIGQLCRSGKLSKLGGLVIGHMSLMKDTEVPFGMDVQHLILDHVAEYDFPVLFNFPVGHEPLNLSIMQEELYRLEVTDKGGELRRANPKK
jgi:muramoyltetrapeptide carboxypeptidase